MRVVFDTNVYISAVLNPGICRTILLTVREKRHAILISAAILQEIDRILRVKIKRSPAETLFILRTIEASTQFVSPLEKITAVKADDTDNRIIECAVEGKADFIVSGDKKHLLSLQHYKGIKILSPTEFLDIFNEK